MSVRAGKSFTEHTLWHVTKKVFATTRIAPAAEEDSDGGNEGEDEFEREPPVPGCTMAFPNGGVQICLTRIYEMDNFEGVRPNIYVTL
jgi:hypothetical protein